MKLKISAIAKGKVNTKFGEKDSYRFTNESDGITYSSFYNPTVAAWKVGDEVETEVQQNGKYWNIVTPKQGGSTQSNNAQLDRIEKKLDHLLHLLGAQSFTHKPVVETVKLPFQDSPHPSDEDAPF